MNTSRIDVVGKLLVIFKSDVPMSHRGAFVLAGLSTIAALQRLVRSAGLDPIDFLPAALFWLVVVYQWKARKTLKWQLKNAEGHGHNTPADWIQSGINRLPDSIYLVLAILAAFTVYWAFTRG